MWYRSLPALVLFAALLGPFTAAAADTTPAYPEDNSPTLKEQFLNLLPPAISDDLDITAWGWLGDEQEIHGGSDNYWDGELALAATKSFQQRLAITAQGDFIDADNSRRVELEQGYASILLDQQRGSYLTAGKFNANFGEEPRDFWNRTTGSTSLLFAAQPQDLVGIMLTQPLGNTDLTLRPFVASDFQGQFYFNQSPSVGMITDYRPAENLDLALTPWIGPGYVMFGGRRFHSPYPVPDYGQGDLTIANWQGPNITGEQGGTLYFIEAAASWQATSNFKLSGEYLFANTNVTQGHFGWYGWMALADYNLSDTLHLFARWSFLDDSNWLITGTRQTIQELSAGFGYQLLKGLEFRTEFRHEYSDSQSVTDSVSAHLTFTY